MTGVDVYLPFEIATGNASIGRRAGLQGLIGERPLPAEFRAFSGSLVDPPSAQNTHWSERHQNVAKGGARHYVVARISDSALKLGVIQQQLNPRRLPVRR